MSHDDPLIGRQLAGYRLDRVLGRGGMATVYYGWDVSLDRPVAVKVIDARYQGDAEYAARFVNEARLVAAWHHPNVLQVHYAGDEDGLYFFAMEYVRGSDLGVRLGDIRWEGKMMAPDEILRIGRAVGEALDYARERGVIHRDVKPTNVLLADDGRVMLADFGLALNVAQGTMGNVFGSPHYIAPEQARNSAQAVPQSDLYALGVILYEMLTGRVPFDDPSPATLAMQHITEAPPLPRQFNPALSAATEAMLLKALSKKPEERFQTGHELMEALAVALDVPQSTLPELANSPRLNGHPEAANELTELSQMKLTHRLEDLPSQGSVGASVDGAAEQPAANLAVGAAVARPAGVPPRLRDAMAGAAARWRRNPAALRRLGCVVGLLLVPILGFAGLNLAGSLAESIRSREAGLRAGTATTATLAAGASEGPAATTPAAPPGGHQFKLYYDDTGLYFHNLSGQDRALTPIAFERIGQDGNPANRFDGRRWSEIYGTHREGYCAVVELIDYRDHMNPEPCRNRFIVVRTPFANEPHIFWTTQEGSTQFRVLWDGNEVGRCEIAAQECEVYLP